MCRKHRQTRIIRHGRSCRHAAITLFRASLAGVQELRFYSTCLYALACRQTFPRASAFIHACMHTTSKNAFDGLEVMAGTRLIPLPLLQTKKILHSAGCSARMLCVTCHSTAILHYNTNYKILLNIKHPSYKHPYSHIHPALPIKLRVQLGSCYRTFSYHQRF